MLKTLDPETAKFPETKSFCVPVFGNAPIPTEFPVITKSLRLNAPMTTVLSSNASIIGNPAISLTLKRDPERLSVTENSLPFAPSTLNLSNPVGFET